MNAPSSQNPSRWTRQQGIEIYGHLEGRGTVNFNYWISAQTGTGRGAKDNDDGNLLYVARLQWNVLGRTFEMSGSDIERTEKPTLIIAAAGATNRSPYTRFSQSGGGELEDYPEGLAGQYRVKQAVIETAFKYRGFSWQHETHFKQINDKINNIVTNLNGTYVQAGYFLHESIDAVPRQLEVTGLYAVYRPNANMYKNSERQYSLAMNWFFSEHKNKLTAQYDYIVFDQPPVNKAEGSRFRLQWDISF